jgi:hypothetical protein
MVNFLVICEIDSTFIYFFEVCLISEKMSFIELILLPWSKRLIIFFITYLKYLKSEWEITTKRTIILANNQNKTTKC